MHFDEPFGGVIQGPRGAVLSALLRTGEPLTGREVHALVKDRYSLWSVQEALRSWVGLGILETRSVGRATLHSVNEAHSAVSALRTLVDPIAALTAVVREHVDGNVQAVVLFGSLARGDATADSDIDLAVVTSSGWDNRFDLGDAIRLRLGNDCDVLVFSEDEFSRLASSEEPVVLDILREGVPLVGRLPRVSRGVA